MMAANEAYQVAPGLIYQAAKPQRDPAYQRWIKCFPCIACGSTRQVGPCHTGPHGLGRKSDGYPVSHECRDGTL
jgi:hypothetical protein